MSRITVYHVTSYHVSDVWLSIILQPCVSLWGYITSNKVLYDDSDWRICGWRRKWSWSILRHCNCIGVEELRKIKKKLEAEQPVPGRDSRLIPPAPPEYRQDILLPLSRPSVSSSIRLTSCGVSCCINVMNREKIFSELTSITTMSMYLHIKQ
jgi:hypothetical protein